VSPAVVSITDARRLLFAPSELGEGLGPRELTGHQCSMADDRVAKYCADLDQLAAAVAGNAGASAKCAAEVRKLCTYLQKHQEETLRDKGKLAELAGRLYKLVSGGADPKLLDQIVELHETLMSLPEGKLLGSSAKQKVLRSLESLRGLQGNAEAGSSSAGASAAPRQTVLWELLELAPRDGGDGATLSLMDPATGDEAMVDCEDTEEAAKLKDGLENGDLYPGSVVQVRLEEVGPGTGWKYLGHDVEGLPALLMRASSQDGA